MLIYLIFGNAMKFGMIFFYICLFSRASSKFGNIIYVISPIFGKVMKFGMIFFYICLFSRTSSEFGNIVYVICPIFGKAMKFGMIFFYICLFSRTSSEFGNIIHGIFSIFNSSQKSTFWGPHLHDNFLALCLSSLYKGMHSYELLITISIFTIVHYHIKKYIIKAEERRLVMFDSRTGEILIDILRSHEVERIYGMPGNSINEFIDDLRKREDDIDFIQVRHEEVGALAAASQAKLTGKIGVCLSIAGPGAIHLLNGLYDAQKDKVPVLAIVGQVFSTQLKTD